MVGDPAQLPAIEHAGAFRALVDRLGAIELSEVRRLRDPVERAAVELVREGRGSSALAAYEQRGRLTLADSIAELEATVVADRHRAQADGADAIVLARTRARTGRLNELAQSLRLAEGELGGEGIEVGEGRIHAGDLVVTRVNRGGREPVHNRERWAVEAIDPAGRTMTLRHLTEHERVVTLERDYLDRRLPDAVGAVELGYAITKYGAQGMTVDRAFCVLTDGLSKEDVYVALTRARDATELYAVAREPVERAEFAPAPELREVGVAELGREIERSEGLALAIDERLRAELERRLTPALVDELARLEAVRDDPDTRRAEAIRVVRAEAQAELAEARRDLAASSMRGPERAYREAIVEHAAGRLRALAEEERALPVTETIIGHARERSAAIERILAERRRERVATAIEFEPTYLVEAIGRRPDGLRSRLEWERAVDRVERLRQRLGVRDSGRALGRIPSNPSRSSRWQEAERELELLRVRLRDRTAVRERRRVAGIGIER